MVFQKPQLVKFEPNFMGFAVLFYELKLSWRSRVLKLTKKYLVLLAVLQSCKFTIPHYLYPQCVSLRPRTYMMPKKEKQVSSQKR